MSDRNSSGGSGSGELGAGELGAGELGAGDPLAPSVADVGREPVTGIDPDQIPAAERAPESLTGRSSDILRSILGGSALLSVLAVVVGLVAGAVLIAATSPSVQTASAYLFARPGDTFVAIWTSVSQAYVSLFQGGVYDWTAQTFAGAIAPILNSIEFATPLIAAGLGVGLAFRAGMFNIGAQGQILIGGMLSGWVGFALPLPAGIHVIVAVAAALIGGGAWAFIVGLLKARTGAHEVIVTIMLNYVAIDLLAYLLTTPFLQAPGSNDPKSPDMLPNAVFPNLLGSQYFLNIGILLVIAATIFASWLLNRSSLGFKFRAVGENPKAARVAGIDVPLIYIYVMVISGALVGLAGAIQVIGQQTGGGFSGGLDAGVGFTAITVALLGRSRPWGVFAAGILFGIMDAGGYRMASAEQISVYVVSVIQAVVVLFIAAPPLVRAIFRLPNPGGPRRSGRRPSGPGTGSSVISPAASSTTASSTVSSTKEVAAK